MGERFSVNGFVAGAGEDHSEGLLAELAAVQCLAAESPKGGDEFEGFSGGYGYGGRRSLDGGEAWRTSPATSSTRI